MTAQEALVIAREIVDEGEYAALTKTGPVAVAVLVDEFDRLRAVIGNAAANLEDIHGEDCANNASAYRACDCLSGRIRAALTKAVSL